MAKGPKGEWVWMECSSCGERNYRTTVSAKPGQTGQTKLELQKYCPRERKHTTHKLRRK